MATKSFSLTCKNVAALTFVALLSTSVLSTSAFATSKKNLIADSSSFCTAIESGGYTSVTPTPSSSYRKFIPKGIKFYQSLEAVAPNATVGSALKDIVKILKNEEGDQSTAALSAAILANASNFVHDISTVSKALLKCV